MENNLTILNQQIDKCINEKAKLRHLQGMRAVLEYLLVYIPCEGGIYKRNSFITINDAYELYKGHQTDYIPGYDTRLDKKHFKEQLCHPQHVLGVYIINDPNIQESYILLKSEGVDIASFINTLLRKPLEFERLELNIETVQSIIMSLDTEWDKKAAKVLLCANKSLRQIEALGIDPTKVQQMVDDATLSAEEIQNTLYAAEDTVQLRLHHKQEIIDKEISTLENLVQRKATDWPKVIIEKKEEEIRYKKEQLENVIELIEAKTKTAHRKLQQMRKRKAEQLAEDHRLKRRRVTNQGAPRLTDSSDEEFLAKCIEDKATYHGRRHDLVMYTNRRVKKRDLLSIANYKLAQRNKKLIKSSTTAYNRSKPKNVRSLQAKHHLGKGLFCCKKPPKAEDSYNENTHYQRAHVKLVKEALFSTAVQNQKPFYIMRSIDDKAYTVVLWLKTQISRFNG